MGYDRERSPYGTRIFLTCYCLFLLVNILLYSNNISQIKKNKIQSELKIILLCFINLLIFSISFYGLWFAKKLILCLIGILYFILLCTSFISIILLKTNILSLKTSLYFSHNYIWLIKSSTYLLSIINLLLSCLLNIFALCGICHLYSCIEYKKTLFNKSSEKHYEFSI